jgi:transcription elongation factor Elf1
MTKPWKDIKHKKDKIIPALTGTLTCPRGHQRLVVDFNPNRVSVLCAQCGFPVSIKIGFTQ